ncbi:MAG: CotH kinase family protein [Bacteroidota bacterium]
MTRRKILRHLFSSLLLLSTLLATAQSIRINEVAIDNNIFEDSDGETKDWIELYNTSDQTIALDNWTITDDKYNPQKWTFPTVDLKANDFFTLFASGKDRNQLLRYQTVIRQGDACKYVIPTSTTSSDWRSLDFDDRNWQDGQTGIGYGDDDDQTTVPHGTRSVFLRQTFTLDSPTDIQGMRLHMDYDDGFVAYLNGMEIARGNMEAGEFPPYYAGVLTDREATLYEDGTIDLFEIDDAIGVLEAGKNVLAVQVHNVHGGSSDLSIIPFLTLETTDPKAVTDVADVIGRTASFLHTNFKLSAGETIYLYNANGVLQDSLSLPSIPSNVTVGRFPDGATNVRFFGEITPDDANSPSNFVGVSTDTINFSVRGGIYENTQTVRLSSKNEQGIIRYTTDGSNPTINSNSYKSPLTVSENQTIKATVFQEDYLSPMVSTAAYLIGVTHDLPVLSIAFDNADFFDENTGIYTYGTDYEDQLPFFGANFWKDLEKPVHLTFFENGRTAFATGAGAKIFGGWSRANDQRSLSLFFRSQYGDKDLRYPLFPERNYEKLEAVVLRNSGNDWQRTMLRDLTLTGLMNNSNVDYQQGRPIVAYLNGQYWGIYNIREKVNEHLLAGLHSVSTDGLTILEKDGVIVHGDNKDYNDLINFVNDNSLTNAQNYEQVINRIDLANFIQYYVAQIFFDNADWPGNNIKFWKAKDGKWRWILFDTDFGFGIWDVNRYRFNTLEFALNPSGPSWPNPPWSTLLFRKLVENETFQKQFINTFCDEMNTRFKSDKIRAAIDENQEIVRNEMPAHIDRWGKSSMTAWSSKVNDMKTFANQRSIYVRDFIKKQFNLPTHRLMRLAINDTEAGSVQLNTVRIQDAEFSGYYYPSVPITLTAVAQAGYVFSHWSGSSETDEPTITLDPIRAINLTAHFVKKEADTKTSEVIFNEINYNSPQGVDIGDWVELYNNGSEQDLTDWVFKDSDDAHIFTFPVGTILGENEYLVLTRDNERFTSRFPEVTNKIGDFDFGLSSDGEFIRLYDNANNLVDSVFYLPDNGWPELANGEGPSLELIDPDSDNTLPENWVTYNSNGTPGRENGSTTSVKSESIYAKFIQINPNPFDEHLIIDVDLPQKGDLQVDLLTVNGQIIKTLVPSKQLSQERIVLQVPVLTAGNYLVQILVNGEQIVKTVVKL